MQRIYLGLDPGAGGGLAAIFPDGSVDAVPMPDTVLDVWDWISRKAHPGYGVVAYLEKVGGFMGAEAGEKGGKPNRAAGHTMFTFGASFGRLQMSLAAGGIRYEEVVPRRWQGILSIPPRAKTESKTEWKRRLKEKAQQLFLGVKVTLATSDAILLAEACRRMNR